MIPIVQIKKPRLREVKGLLLAYRLVSVAARFHWTQGQAVSSILTALFTLLTHTYTNSFSKTNPEEYSITFDLVNGGHEGQGDQTTGPASYICRCGAEDQVSWALGHRRP